MIWFLYRRMGLIFFVAKLLWIIFFGHCFFRHIIWSAIPILVLSAVLIICTGHMGRGSNIDISNVIVWRSIRKKFFCIILYCSFIGNNCITSWLNGNVCFRTMDLICLSHGKMLPSGRGFIITNFIHFWHCKIPPFFKSVIHIHSKGKIANISYCHIIIHPILVKKSKLACMEFFRGQRSSFLFQCVSRMRRFWFWYYWRGQFVRRGLYNHRTVPHNNGMIIANNAVLDHFSFMIHGKFLVITVIIAFYCNRFMKCVGLSQFKYSI